MTYDDFTTLIEQYPLYLQMLALFGGALLFSFLLVTAFSVILKATNRKLDSYTIKAVTTRMRGPLFWFITLSITTITWAGITVDDDSPFYLIPAVRIVRTLLYISGAFVLVRFVNVISDTVRHRFDSSSRLDNLTERKILTQLEYIQRIAVIVIGIVAIAFILLQFEGVRSLGQGILASAGITGIIVGLAAQKSIVNLLAGFQIAFTQPIRVDDKLIINGEFGVVEEITLTYVVLKLWDERRMIIPLQFFIDNAFQNWTHTSSNLVGTIFLYVDYNFPVDELRKEFNRFLETREDWDRRVSAVQLTDITDKVMQLRVLASGKDSGTTFNLRCAVREHLIGFIQREYPNSLPKVRTHSPTVEDGGSE